MSEAATAFFVKMSLKLVFTGLNTAVQQLSRSMQMP